jgi:hypothetical protein
VATGYHANNAGNAGNVTPTVSGGALTLNNSITANGGNSGATTPAMLEM